MADSRKSGDGLEDMKAPKGLSSSTGGRSLRQSLDIMKRKKDRSPKTKKHKRSRSGSASFKKAISEARANAGDEITTKLVSVSPLGSPKSTRKEKGQTQESHTSAEAGNSLKKKLKRTTSFHRSTSKKDLEDEIVLRTQSLEASKASKKLGRAKSFNQGMAKLDMVLGRAVSRQKGTEAEASKAKVVGVSAPKGTIRMSENERLKFIRSLSSTTSMKVTKIRKEQDKEKAMSGQEMNLELQGISESAHGKNYVKRRVVAKSEWRAKDEAELTVKPGDVILIHGVDSNGWAEGSIVIQKKKTLSDDNTAVGNGDGEERLSAEIVAEDIVNESKENDQSGDNDKKSPHSDVEGKGNTEDEEVNDTREEAEEEKASVERKSLCTFEATDDMSAPGWFPLKVMLPPGRLQNIPSGVSLMLNADADGSRAVDESSIVCDKETTEQRLQKHLEHRPDKKDLEARYIVDNHEEETNPISRAIEKKKIGDLLTGIFSSKKSKKKKKSSGLYSPRDSSDDEGALQNDFSLLSDEETTREEEDAIVEDESIGERHTRDGKDSNKEPHVDSESRDRKAEPQTEATGKGKREKGMSPLAYGVELFNEKPEKGIEYFLEQNISIVGNTAESIARFLYKFTHFDRVQLGEFLGSKGELNEQILDAVLSQLDFSSLEFDMALRRFLYAFRLPGEAQKIDRLMLAFAKKYFDEHSGGIFADVDAIYILSFSVVMLNTDLHNASIKKKMASEQFVHQNRGINGGGDFPPELLIDIYDMIMDDEIRDKKHDHFSGAMYRSWAGHYVGGGKRKYKRKWVVVDESGLFILDSPNAREPQHVFMYDEITYIKDLGTPKGEFRMKLRNQEEHYFCAKTPRHVKIWVAKVNLMRCRVGYLKVTQMEQEASLQKAKAEAVAEHSTAEEHDAAE